MLSGSSGWTKSALPKTPAATSRIAPSARPCRPTARWSAAATRSFSGRPSSPEAESRTRDQAELDACAARERRREQAGADELGEQTRAQPERQLLRVEPDRDVPGQEQAGEQPRVVVRRRRRAPGLGPEVVEDVRLGAVAVAERERAAVDGAQPLERRARREALLERGEVVRELGHDDGVEDVLVLALERVRASRLLGCVRAEDALLEVVQRGHETPLVSRHEHARVDVREPAQRATSPLGPQL